jgi:hypothetical protein
MEASLPSEAAGWSARWRRPPSTCCASHEALPEVNADARWLVGVASVVFPAAAVLAAMALRRGALRWAGVFLLVSVATPTYYAYPLNIPALVAGLVLLAAPSIVDGSRHGSVTRREQPALPTK